MHRNPRPGPAGMTYGGPATLPAPDAPVTASAHPASSERPEEDWGRQGTSPRRVDPTRPAPSTMADDAYRDTRMHSAGAKVAAEHDYAAGVAAERRRDAPSVQRRRLRRGLPRRRGARAALPGDHAPPVGEGAAARSHPRPSPVAQPAPVRNRHRRHRWALPGDTPSRIVYLMKTTTNSKATETTTDHAAICDGCCDCDESEFGHLTDDQWDMANEDGEMD